VVVRRATVWALFSFSARYTRATERRRTLIILPEYLVGVLEMIVPIHKAARQRFVHSIKAEVFVA
jgi:hypothetical protein